MALVSAFFRFLGPTIDTANDRRHSPTIDLESPAASFSARFLLLTRVLPFAMHHHHHRRHHCRRRRHYYYLPTYNTHRNSCAPSIHEFITHTVSRVRSTYVRVCVHRGVVEYNNTILCALNIY